MATQRQRTSIRTDDRRGARERGFALLLVFLIAAGILIGLYMEIPRVAFESQRNLEQTLIDRGEQYSRGIEVFYRKNRRYPQKIEELESFNNMRFLRRRYTDPLTGKDDWKLLMMGPNGQISNSLIPKTGVANGLNAGQNGQTGQTDGTNGQQANGAGGSGFGQPLGTPLGQTDPNAQPGQPGDMTNVNVAMNRLRQSDKSPAGGGVGGAPSPIFDPNNPNAQQQQQQLQQVDANGNPINPDPNQAAAAAGNNPGFQSGVNQPGQPGYNQPGQPGYNPNLPPSYPNQPGINPGGVQPGQNTLNQNNPNYPGQQNPQSPFNSGNPALNAINNQLRGGSGFGGNNFGGPGNNGNNTGSTDSGGSGSSSGFNLGGPNAGNGLLTSSQTSNGQTIGGGGIAGVASVQPGIGIKRYNDRKKYKEWEFVFDYTKTKAASLPGAQNPMGNSTTSGSNATSSTSGFGSGSGGFGSGSSGFGSGSTSGTPTMNPPANPPQPPPPPPPNQ